MSTDETKSVAEELKDAIKRLATRGFSRAKSFPAELLEALEIDATAPEPVVREHVGRRLMAASEELTPDRRTVFRTGLGLLPGSPLTVEERFDLAGDQIQRSGRTARRHFEDAVEQICMTLAVRGNESVLADIDYAFVRARTSIDLRHERPVIANTRVISVRSHSISYIDERIGLRAYQGDTLHLRAVEGCDAVETKRVGPGLWSLRLRFPQPLRRGEQHGFTVSFELPDQDSLEPIAGFLPYTASYDAAIVLRFGAKRPAMLERFCTPPPAEQLAVRFPGSELITPDRSSYEFVFDQMRVGYCHGVRWHWDGPPAEELTIP
ncbi:MAG TPA: hypothetical protein PKE40_01140 [Arachnia sp.]|nr:hypothetical protein [Arachnia sp.]HMT84932.1 hypothetical protein [Arachnia sp.]